MQKDVPLWVFVLALVAVVSVAFAVVIKTQWDIQSQLQVLGYELKVYEVDGENECTAITWGSLGPGDSGYYDIIAKNTGDYWLNLNMSTTLDSSVGTVSWNHTGPILHPNNSTALRLTLNISDTALRGSYAFNVTICGWIS